MKRLKRRGIAVQLAIKLSEQVSVDGWMLMKQEDGPCQRVRCGHVSGGIQGERVTDQLIISELCSVFIMRTHQRGQDIGPLGVFALVCNHGTDNAFQLLGKLERVM